jgi:orotate phosphoribosyltransferase
MVRDHHERPTPEYEADQALKRDLLAAAVLHGTFTLRSGKTSSYYVDKYRFQARPELLRRVAAAVARLVPPETEWLAGVELGAVPLVTAVSLHTGIPFVIVRKDAKAYGTANLIEGGEIAGRAVTLVEDVCTTGGAALAAAEQIARAGGRLRRIITVIDRGEGGIARERAAGYDAVALFTLTPDELASPLPKGEA